MEQFVQDDELIRQYQGGEENAMCELLERHKKKVYSYILNVVREKHIAEDIFQETFFKVIRTLKKQQYNGEGKFIQWVMRISHNLIIDHFRQNKKRAVWSDCKCGRNLAKSWPQRHAFNAMIAETKDLH